MTDFDRNIMFRVKQIVAGNEREIALLILRLDREAAAY
jgi:hypothetical protein